MNIEQGTRNFEFRSCTPSSFDIPCPTGVSRAGLFDILQILQLELRSEVEDVIGETGGCGIVLSVLNNGALKWYPDISIGQDCLHFISDSRLE
jgi:hypothetical protein